MRVVVLCSPVGRHCGGRILVHHQGGGDTLANALIWSNFVRWLRKNTGENFDRIDLAVVRENFLDETYDGAIRKAENDELTAPFLTMESQLDYNEQNPLYTELYRLIGEARTAGATDRDIVRAIRQTGLELERPTSAGLASAQKRIKQLTEEIEDLRRRLEEARKPAAPAPPPPPSLPMPNEDLKKLILGSYATALVERGIPLGRAREIASDRQLDILAESSIGRNEEEAERIAELIAEEDFPQIREREQARTVARAAPGPSIDELGGVSVSGAVKLRIVYSDGTVQWSGIIAQSTAKGIVSGTLKVDPGARIEYFDPDVQSPDDPGLQGAGGE